MNVPNKDAQQREEAQPNPTPKADPKTPSAEAHKPASEAPNSAPPAVNPFLRSAKPPAMPPAPKAIELETAEAPSSAPPPSIKAEDSGDEPKKVEEPSSPPPKPQMPDSPASKTETQPSTPVDTAGKVVMIVEDTIELAEVLQATLERMGLKTVHETHANRALDIFKSQKPQIVLLDIGLPDKSGWKLLEDIKELDKQDRPQFIIITAYGDPANRLMGKLQDVASYLIKPFSPDDVERVVNKVLSTV